MKKEISTLIGGRVLLPLAALLLTLTGCQDGDPAAGPSLVTFEGRQLLVRRRGPDGELPAPATPLVIRGVVWSPAGRDTRTWGANPDHARVMREELLRWQAQDIPLLADLGVNTVRLLVDPGVRADAAAGRRLLDALYARFLGLRLSSQWRKEVEDMRQWMTRTE